VTTDARVPLAGYRALVSGAGSGIGAAIARALADAGATLTLLGRREAALEATRATLAGSGHRCLVADVTDPASFADLGAIDLLVNNAGAAHSAPFARTDAAHWRQMLDVNLMGAVHLTQAVLPAMRARGFGRIVNIASTAALAGYAYVSAYCAAKHALLGFTRALALEVAREGITVNAVCPGYTDTPLLDGAVANIAAKTGAAAEHARAGLAAGNPQRRLVTPHEVAHAVRWLCEPGASAVHGQAIVVAGGEVMAG
jgi:3-hydroxybutyrate dehydrogenase